MYLGGKGSDLKETLKKSLNQTEPFRLINTEHDWNFRELTEVSLINN